MAILGGVKKMIAFERFVERFLAKGRISLKTPRFGLRFYDSEILDHREYQGTPVCSFGSVDQGLSICARDGYQPAKLAHFPSLFGLSKQALQLFRQRQI